MKLFDYTGLLNVIKEVNLETDKLNNFKDMALKNRYLDLESELFDSGILEDWLRLNKVITTRIFMNRWNSEHLNKVYRDTEKFIEYADNIIHVTMSSGSHWSDYLCINPKASVENGRIIWCVTHSTDTHFFERFRSEEEEYKTKILLIEALMRTYEAYREFALQKIAEELNKKIEKNHSIKREIDELI